jgi:hypothetical protein
LDLAVAVASGTPCLRRFSVPQPGRVLLYAAEDALHIVRSRLEGICAAAGIGLRDLDVHVITAPTLRLDLPTDRGRLQQTVADLAPRLLVLDPFVRLHRIDENASGEVAPLLAYLRELQRHAWGDSNLYLRRDGPKLTLTVEHRAAPSTPAIELELVSRNEALALEVLTSAPCESPASTSIDERITAALLDASQPLSISELRLLCRVRNATLYERLTAMTAAGRLHRGADGYRIAAES